MRSRVRLIWISVVVCYFILHTLGLTRLPVFADESIYIRWAQLIWEEGSHFLFFSLNDGKTPLYIWTLALFQELPFDQLLISRFVSVFVGLAQMGVMVGIASTLAWSLPAQLFVACITMIAPYWYFHHRMALMDGMLVLWLSCMSWVVLKLANQELLTQAQEQKLLSDVRQKKVISIFGFSLWQAWAMKWKIILGGLFFGLALWTKLPAVLFGLPVLFLLLYSDRSKPSFELGYKVAAIAGMGVLGIALFGLQKLHPAFGQLFARGSDFLYPVSVIVGEGKWRDTLLQAPTFTSYFWQYLTPGLCLLIVAGLFSFDRRKVHTFFWAGVVFVLPILVLGKVVYPRYLLPAAFFLTLAAAQSFESWHSYSLKAKSSDWKYALSFLGILTVIVNFLATSMTFVGATIMSPEAIPFVSADQVQYQTEWSAGFGNVQVVEWIKEARLHRTVAIATEGTFGTLPDGLLLYFHNRESQGIYIEGIGQPVRSFPDFFVDRALKYDQTVLVVNSHRMMIELPRERLLMEVCRPAQAPCLQLWDVTDMLEELRKKPE